LCAAIACNTDISARAAPLVSRQLGHGVHGGTLWANSHRLPTTSGRRAVAQLAAAGALRPTTEGSSGGGGGETPEHGGADEPESASDTEPEYDYAKAAAGDGSSVDCIRITALRGADLGALSDVLLSLGATCCSVEDADLGTDAEQELYAGDNKVWGSCNITVMFAPDSDIPGIMADAEEILQATVEYVAETIPGNDWVKVVLDSFTPTKVIDGLWIVPAWCDAPAEDPDALSVVLEPGLAFGTGEHPTTRLCLGWLRTNGVAGKYVMDFGTGSGVLAIGALLMGADRAVGVDIDPLSVTSAGTNAELNGVRDRLALYCTDGSRDAELPPGRGDVGVLVANILVGPVLDLESLFARYVAPGGRVCLSGILVTQTPRCGSLRCVL